MEYDDKQAWLQRIQNKLYWPWLNLKLVLVVKIHKSNKGKTEKRAFQRKIEVFFGQMRPLVNILHS